MLRSLAIVFTHSLLLLTQYGATACLGSLQTSHLCALLPNSCHSCRELQLMSEQAAHARWDDSVFNPPRSISVHSYKTPSMMSVKQPGTPCICFRRKILPR